MPRPTSTSLEALEQAPAPAEAERARAEIAERAYADASRELARVSAEFLRVDDELRIVEGSIARRAVRFAKRFSGYALVRRAAARALSLREPQVRRPRRDPLGFAGVAAACSHESAAALAAARPRVVGVCHPDWRGIRAAAYARCDAVLEVEAVKHEAHASAIGELLAGGGARAIVLEGIPPGSELLLRTLRRAHPALRLLHVFHGSPAQHAVVHDEAELLHDMLELARAGVLDGVGFVKAGLAESFRRLGYSAYPLYNRTRRQDRSPPRQPIPGELHVGVFAPDAWHKNVSTQVLAALTLPGTVVHVNHMPRARYLADHAARIRVHGLLPHAEFLELAAKMDANLYVSLTECYPMTVLESLERGVLCLTSHTSPIFDDEPYLFEKLVVTRHDDPAAIGSKLERALAERERIIERARAHVDALDRRAVELWEEFTHG